VANIVYQSTKNLVSSFIKAHRHIQTNNSRQSDTNNISCH